MPASETSSSTQRYRLRGPRDDVERTWPILSGRNRVGRDIHNELVIDEEGVSRHHATVWLEAGRLVITDANSKNGTFVNGQPVTRAEISAGDLVAFGPFDLLCETAPVVETVLAVDLTATGEMPASSPQTDTATAKSIAGDRASWLALGRAFSSTLRKTGEGSEALAVLATTLRLRGAALLRRTTAQPPTLVTATGRVEANEVEAITAAWATSGRSFAMTADLSGYAPSEASYPWCLVLAGDFHHREESSELLALLVESYASWHTRGVSRAVPSGSSNVGTSPPRLRFPPGYISGSSPAMRAVFRQMKSLALDDRPVLVIGETGVGKELIVRTLHLSSPRAGKPLVAINCAAVPGDLLEAEFFGIGDRVATGVAGRKGLFRGAAGGTILLDEVGSMALDLQAKLLRVLQEREVFPVGSSTPIAIDVRVLAATNAVMPVEISSGRFRSDLYYRLAGHEIHIPPLRDRVEDIPALVEHFLRDSSDQVDHPIRGLTAGAMHELVSQPWPGNVRQLEHEIRALVFGCPPGGIIDTGMLRARTAGVWMTSVVRTEPAAATPTATSAPPVLATGRDTPPLELGALEKSAVEEALRRSAGNQRRAAELLGITRSSLRRRLKRYDLR